MTAYFAVPDRHADRPSAARMIGQILELKAEGLTYRQIGERLGVTEEAVSTAVRRQRSQVDR